MITQENRITDWASNNDTKLKLRIVLEEHKYQLSEIRKNHYNPLNRLKLLKSYALLLATYFNIQVEYKYI
jgi:hypothetical protein